MNFSAERGDGMLNYLEQGSVLYLMAAICVIGVIGRFVANHFYKSLIRQADNLVSAKDRQLQQMKMKYESIYRMNCGMKNTGAFVSKMQQQYRVAGIRLVNWESSSIYCGILAFLVGALSSLVLYLNNGTAQNCILYLAGGSLMAAAMISFSGAVDGGTYRDTLEASLIHYFENVLVVRSPRDMPDSFEEEDVRSDGMKAEASEREALRSSAAARSKGTMRDDLFMRSEKKEDPVRKHEDGDSLSQQKQLEELKESLAQIAAARGDSGDKQNRRQQGKKLTPKEEQLINEIINQYLS